MKVCAPIFDGDVAFAFTHIKDGQVMMLHVRDASHSPHTFLQTSPESGVCLSVFCGSVEKSKVKEEEEENKNTL